MQRISRDERSGDWIRIDGSTRYDFPETVLPNFVYRPRQRTFGQGTRKSVKMKEKENFLKIFFFLDWIFA